MKPEIALVVDFMFGEPWLPDGKLHGQLLSNFVGGAAFDELDGLLERDGFARSQNNVEMVGHNDVTVDQKVALVAIVKDSFFQDCCGGLATEEGAALPRIGGDEVGPTRPSSMFRSCHDWLRGLKPRAPRVRVGGVKTPPFPFRPSLRSG